MYHNGQSVLVLLAPKICEGVEEIALFEFLQWSLFDLIYSVRAVLRSAAADWTGLSAKDTWFPYLWGTGEAFHLPVGHTTVSSKLPLDGNDHIRHRVLPARVVCFAFNQLDSKDQGHGSAFSSDGAPSSAFSAMSGVQRDDELHSQT